MNRIVKIKVALILFAAFFASYVAFGHYRLVSAQALQTETAGQHFKNIKVLNDMPADQLGKVMNIMAASLGVNCDFCHYGEDFEKDGKKEKDSAREMIKMTFDINRNSFRGRTEVSCATCHNGHEHPASVPNLYPPVADERPKQPETKPTVDAIVAKYIAAVGGEARLAKITSRQITSTRIEPDGKTTEPETKWFKGDKYYGETLYGKTVVSEGYDGTKGWKAGNKAAIRMKPDEAQQLRREAQLFSPANIKAIYPKMEYRFTDRIDGREVYLVTASDDNGNRERLYFDAQTGFLVRRSAATQTVLGNYVYQVDYADYKMFQGVMVPTKISYAMPNIRWVSKVIAVKNNAPVEDSRFTAITVEPNH